MKLIDRYNRVSLLSTILVIAVAGFVYYFTISYILTSQIDKDLVVEENEICDYVAINNHLPQVFKSDHLKIKFQPVDNQIIRRQFVNTHFFDEQEQVNKAGRTLISSVKVNKHAYRVEITVSTVQTDYLIRLIFLITLGIILALLTTLLIVNRILMRKLWRPFYRTLQQIKFFNVADRNGINPVDSKIDEFRDLNLEIKAMSDRVLQDYRSLKTFTENASHELMTPLAVIISKLETLMQDSEITEKQGNLIAEAYQTVDRLKKLNRSMLLLARIENKLMPDMQVVDLGMSVSEKISELQELLIDKNINITSSLGCYPLQINRDLLNILLNNLLGNAILHNKASGEILVTLDGSLLTITNSGVQIPLNEQKIFERFQKSPESEGSGLGLTLVKQICDNYGFWLCYAFENQMHCFKVLFSNR